MKIRLERKNFIDSLIVGASMSGKSKSLPILDMAKISVKGSFITISSYDGEVAITVRTNILESEGDMTFCLNARDLLAILKTLRDEVVELDITQSVCAVLHSKGRMELSVVDSDDFPSPNKDEHSVGIDFSSDILVRWIRNSKNFIEQNDIRPIMSGMYLYYNANEIGCAASNAHKLYWDYEEISCGVIDRYDAVLTTKAMDSLVMMLSNSDNVTIIFSENNICFKTSNAMLLCRKIDGKYPNFKSIIPNSNDIGVDINIIDFKDAINRAILTSGMTHLLKLTCSGINMHIESCDFDFGKKSNEDIVCSVDGDDITIGFNGEFLLDCLNALDAQDISLKMSSPTKPIVLKEAHKTILLMPMRIS